MSESVSSENLNWVHPRVLTELDADGQFRNLSETPIVSSVSTAYERLAAGARVAIVPKDCVDRIDAYGFQQTQLALRRGAQRTYRDQNSQNNLLLREYQSYYLAKLEQYNPDEGRLIEHALTDKLHYTIGAGLLASAAYWAMNRNSK